MSETIRCKDYTIFKIRYYADEKLLKGHRIKGDSLPKQHYERIEIYLNFIWELISFITNKDYNFWNRTYFLDSKACAFDEIWEDYDIRICDSETYCIIMVPKRLIYVSEFIKNKLVDKLPYKIISRVILGYLGSNRDLKYRRNYDKRKTLELFSKID